MKLLVNNISPNVKNNFRTKKQDCVSYFSMQKYNSNILENNQKQLANINKHNLSFKGYYGDIQPAKKLFYIVSGKSAIYEDNWTKSRLIQAKLKKWINAHPAELLKRTPEQAIQSICTLVKPNNKYPEIPSYIPSPNFGDKWGRNANYIEINPRAIAKYESGKITDGLLQTIKLLPAIPCSPSSFANCIVLSQLYPSMYGDGTKDSVSLYTSNLHAGISKNLTSEGLDCKIGADEQVKAFNDLAHLLGFKTGFRMLLPSGQLSVNGEPFNWHKHEKAYIDACIWGIELGFDSIYFDSAKHIIDKNGYCGVGDLPNKEQMAYILYKIREQSGRNDISFIGEKCDDRQEFKELGFTAGTHWSNPDNIDSVKWDSERQAYSREYATGVDISNDNDTGKLDYQSRLNRINNCLFGFNHVNNKLPSFMQLHDFMPLAPDVNTHDLLLKPIQKTDSESWTECERHWDKIFAGTLEADNHRNNVNNIFKNFINIFG